MLKCDNVIQLYAKSVYQFAIQNKSLDQWQDMLIFMTEISLKKEIKHIINNMSFFQQLGNFFISICGSKLDCYGKNLVKVLAEHNRLMIIKDVLNEFLKLRQKYNNILHVKICSVCPLKQEDINEISLIFSKRFEKKIYIDTNIDLSLIGGLIIRFNDTVIDLSIRSRLNRLAYFLKH